ncbi:hypothetical protein [Duganella sp. BuS-21]|uniref:hypothetical protein n=1 Tax=Duganella sp. BuS-21 TaxID=2943848 RepID=UPI0035A6ECED
MEKQIAAELMEEILKLSAQVNVIASKIEGITPDADRMEMRRNIATLMGNCDEHLYRPILRQYPELEPHW